MAWYNDSWTNRVKITILASKVDADLTDYPVYVDLANLPADFHAHVNQTDARDIRITTSDGVSEVPREVVFYTAASDTGELYFKGDIDSDTNTSFYIYYGNALATEPAEDSAYGQENVWNSNYKGVWHLNETSGTHMDTTTNDNDSTSVAVTAQGTATGKIYGADDFERGSSNKVVTTNNASLQITGSLTVSAWVNVEAAPASDQEMAIMGKDSAAVRGWHFSIITDGGAGNVLHTRFNLNGGSWREGFDTVKGNTTINTGQLYYIVGVYDAPNTNIYCYLNGNLDDMGTSTSASTGNAAVALNIGWNAYVGSASYFDGIIDEARIYSGVLPSTWISTEHNNHSSPSTFYLVGRQEPFGPFPTFFRP